MKLAILIAVEKYSDKKIVSVPYADTNAIALSESLGKIGYDPGDQLLLVNDQATKTAIESKVRRAIKSCIEEDQILVYVAGHMISKRDQNYLVCVDTDTSDIENTAIPMQWLFRQFDDSDSQNIVLMIDAGEVPMKLEERMVDPFESRSALELEQYFSKSSRAICFTSCDSGENAHVSRKWKQGIWMHHLLEAFDGKTLTESRIDPCLLGASLQQYLAKSIPQTLITHFSGKSMQTPCLYGCNTEAFVVADLSELIRLRNKSSNPISDLANCVTFFAHRTTPVKGLSGFKKGNAIPDRANHSSQAFIVQLSRVELSEDIQSVFAALKQAFKFKRADISVTDQGDGTGTITTPFFNYSISVEIDPSNPAFVIWRRCVDSIREPEQVFSDKFANVFTNAFDSVEFSNKENLDVQMLIDTVESLEDDRIVIEYDPECTLCTLAIEGITGEIQITKSSFRIVHKRGESPNYLLRSFFAIQKSLVDPNGSSLIPIGGQRR